MLVLGVIILSLQDSLIKFMSSETSFWQLQFIRSIGSIVLLMSIAKFTNGIHLLIPVNWKLYILGYYDDYLHVLLLCSISKIKFPLDAMVFTFPIFVSLLAIIFLMKDWDMGFALILGSSGTVNFRAMVRKFFFIASTYNGWFFFACIILIRKYCEKNLLCLLLWQLV